MCDMELLSRARDLFSRLSETEKKRIYKELMNDAESSISEHAADKTAKGG